MTQLPSRVWQFLTKLNIVLPYDPAIVLLGIYPNELKSYVHTESYTGMFHRGFIPFPQTSESHLVCTEGKPIPTTHCFVKPLELGPASTLHRRYSVLLRNTGPASSM